MTILFPALWLAFMGLILAAIAWVVRLVLRTATVPQRVAITRADGTVVVYARGGKE